MKTKVPLEKLNWGNLKVPLQCDLMNDAIHLKSLLFCLYYTGLHVQYTYEIHIQTNTKQWLPCTAGPTAFPAQSNSHFWQGEDHRSQWTCTASWPLIVFIHIIFIYTSFSKLYHHKSHSVCLHCLFHCKWAWDEVFRHMDQGNRDVGVGQFLVNIKSNCFPTLGVTGDLDRGWWTFDVEGQLGASS